MKDGIAQDVAIGPSPALPPSSFPTAMPSTPAGTSTLTGRVETVSPAAPRSNVVTVIAAWIRAVKRRFTPSHDVLTAHVQRKVANAINAIATPRATPEKIAEALADAAAATRAFLDPRRSPGTRSPQVGALRTMLRARLQADPAGLYRLAKQLKGDTLGKAQLLLQQQAARNAQESDGNETRAEYLLLNIEAVVNESLLEQTDRAVRDDIGAAHGALLAARLENPDGTPSGAVSDEISGHLRKAFDTSTRQIELWTLRAEPAVDQLVLKALGTLPSSTDVAGLLRHATPHQLVRLKRAAAEAPEELKRLESAVSDAIEERFQGPQQAIADQVDKFVREHAAATAEERERLLRDDWPSIQATLRPLLELCRVLELDAPGLKERQDATLSITYKALIDRTSDARSLDEEQAARLTDDLTALGLPIRTARLLLRDVLHEHLISQEKMYRRSLGAVFDRLAGSHDAGELLDDLARLDDASERFRSAAVLCEHTGHEVSAAARQSEIMAETAAAQPDLQRLAIGASLTLRTPMIPVLQAGTAWAARSGNTFGAGKLARLGRLLEQIATAARPA